ncbi:hypothetical protein CG740_09475 [Streptomyces sp. CB01201]|uniref:daptide biosynthesis intramembrane metalloprotease n=1 Tax=Streptomyces sp. CB01201 TaxID=2020324 RepID=UPI000C2795A4|nr:daptide biosynthesis intramembrane metalloprotease [Streptomyces sp. CB01201]PJN03584.1 hypothetical protein CG740_09475 [Streptomyces sp. CB01201]
MFTKTASAELDPERLARPRIAEGVAVQEPMEAGGPWVLHRGGSRYFRVQADLARFTRILDGTRDHEQLAAVLGSPWTAHDVDMAVRKLADHQMLDDGTKPRRRHRRVRFIPPLTVQFTLLRPERLLRLVLPALRPLAGRSGSAAALLCALGGLLALVAQAPSVRQALGSPLPPSTYAGVVLGVLATTVVHEMGHGAVLTYYGGRPTRMGVMLFYLSPAFFCDVSDGWRLPRKEQRVRVALAGVVTQWVIAGAAALTTPLTGPGLREGLIVFAVVTYVSGLLNLLPFVKLDGYLALMSHLDIPHLRDRAMTDARRALGRTLFGGRYERELPELPWAVPYGLICLAFPLYLVFMAANLWGSAFLSMGAAGAALLLCGLGFLAHHLGRGTKSLVREAREAGARTRRIAAVGLGAAVLATACAMLIHLPYTLTGGYTVRDDGRTELLLPTSADRSLVREGATVRLLRSGVTVQQQTGAATVAGAKATAATAPLSMLLPVRTRALPMPVISYPLAVAATPQDRTGTAQLDAGKRPLGEWLYVKYVAPAVRW